MGSLRDALTLIRTTLADDVDIETLCTTYYQRKHKVLIGIDPRNPPDSNDFCPYIAVGLGRRARDAGNHHYIIHELIVGVVINDDADCSDDPAMPVNVVEFKGVSRVDELASLIERKLTKAFDQNGFPNAQSPEFDDQAPGFLFPLFSAAWSYTIRCASRL